jgi:hypothetical protein
MPTLSDILGNARTIAIVLHGVGDHRRSDIVGRTQLFLKAASPEVETVRHHFPDLPQPQGTAPGQSALEIVFDGARHFVLPVRWDSTRIRANNAPIAMGLMGGPSAVMAALPALGEIVTDIVRCVPRAQGRWRLALGALAALLASLICVVVFSTYYFLIDLYAWYLDAGDWSEAIIFVFMALGALWMTSLNIIDFVGDVAGYISRDDSRKSIEDTLVLMIEKCVEAAPEARILVIGHSLGSVLVSQMLLRLPVDRVRKQEIILLTLGSPLCTMAKVFPGFIQSPAALLEKYGQGTVSFWGNLWRDRDIIGRALAPGVSPNFAERSLGDGPHWNYWEDDRLWLRITEILRALDTRDTVKIGTAWIRPDLTTAERVDLVSALLHLNRGQFGTVVISSAALIATVKGVIWFPWPLIAIWLVEFAATFGGFELTKKLLQPRTDLRAWQGDACLMIPLLRRLALTALLAGAILVLYQAFYAPGG